MKYPISYWNKGDIVVVDNPSGCYVNQFFIFIKIRASFYLTHPAGLPDDLAVLYCINDGSTIAIHGTYLREPK